MSDEENCKAFNSLEKYKVKDIHYYGNTIFKEGIHYIFIFESPHIDEVKCGLPLSGRAGKSAMKNLFPNNKDKKISLGKFVSESEINISIMNVSEFPLQKIAYNNAKYKNESGTDKYIKENVEAIEWKTIESIRKSKKYCDEKYSHCILGEFQIRLNEQINKLEESNIKYKIIACGTFAHVFVKKALNQEKNSKIAFVYHPSYGWWGKKRLNRVNKDNSLAKNTLQFLKEIQENIADTKLFVLNIEE